MTTIGVAVPNRPGLRNVAGWALVCGLAGMIANVLLIMFFALGAPDGAEVPGFGWTGTANDIAVVMQFGLFIPVMTGLSRSLPKVRATRVVTCVGVAATACVVVLQVLLVVDVLGFDLQVRLVLPAMSVVFGWLIVVNSIAHRGRFLPPMITRSGLLIGTMFLVGIVLYGAATLLPGGSVARFVVLVPGVVIGGLGWLALPLWPLLLARSGTKSSEVQQEVPEGGE